MRGSCFAVLGVILAMALSGCGPSQEKHDAAPAPRTASAAVLTLSVGGSQQRFSAADLLARADVAGIDAPQDVAYHRAMSYRAVPLRALLASLGPSSDDTLEFRATDGFVASLPRRLIDGAAIPWVAIEDPAHPWPALPNKMSSAGPFYLIWQNPERSAVSPEQWPYSVAAITAVQSPAQRWPGLAADAAHGASAAAQRGEAVFFANCLTCHRLAGAGEGAVGPDLMRPMPATSYFTEAGLRALIRNPASVRTWPEQHMPAFAPDAISDADIGAVIAYLRYQAAHTTPQQRRH